MSTCRRCNRPLKREPFASMGIGRVCLAKERIEVAFAEQEEAQNFPMLANAQQFGRVIETYPPQGVPVILYRTAKRMEPSSRCFTNVPHLVTDHSPTGFEWGYGGSGPADLALNILEVYFHSMGWTGARVEQYRGTCFYLAQALHQAFKEDFLMGMDELGGEIKYEVIRDWVHAYMIDHPELVERDQMYRGVSVAENQELTDEDLTMAKEFIETYDWEEFE